MYLSQFITMSTKCAYHSTFRTTYMSYINMRKPAFYTPPLKKVRGIMLYPPKKFAFECPSVRLSVRPSVRLSVRSSVFRFRALS